MIIAMMKEVIGKSEADTLGCLQSDRKLEQKQLEGQSHGSEFIEDEETKGESKDEVSNEKLKSRIEQVFLCCLIQQKKGLKSLFQFKEKNQQKQSQSLDKNTGYDGNGADSQVIKIEKLKLEQKEKEKEKEKSMESEQKKQKKVQKLLKFPEIQDNIFELYREFRMNVREMRDKISFSEYRRILTVWENLGKETLERLVNPHPFLKYKDLGRLSPGNWLNDEIISSYLSLLKQKMGSAKQKAGLIKQEREVTHQLIILDSLQMTSIFSKKDLSEVHTVLQKISSPPPRSNILGVINSYKHWLFFLLEQPNTQDSNNFMQITIFDSRPQENTFQYTQIDIIKNFLDWAKFYYKKKIIFSICQNFPRQHNNSDCGVMALCGIKDITSGFLFWSFSHQSMNFRRILITKQLIEGSIEDI